MKTYKQLLNYLNTLSSEQLEQACTVMLTGMQEAFGVDNFDVATEDNVAVDPGHLLLLVHDGNTSGQW